MCGLLARAAAGDRATQAEAVAEVIDESGENAVTLVPKGDKAFQDAYVDNNIVSVDYWSLPSSFLSESVSGEHAAKYRRFWVNYANGSRAEFRLDEFPQREVLFVQPGTRSAFIAIPGPPTYRRRGELIYPEVYNESTTPTLMQIAATIRWNNERRQEFYEQAALVAEFMPYLIVDIRVGNMMMPTERLPRLRGPRLGPAEEAGAAKTASRTRAPGSAGTDWAAARQAAKENWHRLPQSQRQMMPEFLGGDEPAAAIAKIEQKGLPPGLERETVEAYRRLAEAEVNTTTNAAAKTLQEGRIDLCDRALRQFEKAQATQAQKTVMTAPRLTPVPESGTKMIGEAVEKLKGVPPDRRIEVFDDFARQIEEATKNDWHADKQPLPDGGAVYIGKEGHALVIDGKGEIFVGKLRTPGHFSSEPGGALTPNYPALKQVK